jgi:dTDP-4-dehydrorhamnose reductase
VRGGRRERPDIEVGPGERLLAWAPLAAGGWVAGTRDALYLPGRRVPWEQVQAADWHAESDRLRVSEIGAWGEPRPVHELAVAEAATPDFAIVRSSWLFGPHGKNFVDTILRAGAERGELAVVHDQVGCPTYTGHLAQALVEIADRRLTGILHVAGGGSCSWYELAVAALDAAGVRCTVTKTTAAEYGRPAPRPAYSVLVSERDDAPRLPAWQDGLAAHLSASRAMT